MNLDRLIDQWIDKQISKYNESVFIMQHNTGVLDMLDDQISALQDLKSRKQELIEGIVGIIESRIKEDGSTDDTPYIKGVQQISNPDMLKGWKACRYEIIKELTGSDIL